MSAFLNSGRSEDGIWSILRGRFRPLADIRIIVDQLRCLLSISTRSRLDTDRLDSEVT